MLICLFAYLLILFFIYNNTLLILDLYNTNILIITTTTILHPTSYIQHPTSNIQHPTSNILVTLPSYGTPNLFSVISQLIQCYLPRRGDLCSFLLYNRFLFVIIILIHEHFLVPVPCYDFYSISGLSS